MTCGVNHARFHRLEGRALVSRRARFHLPDGTPATKQAFLCTATLGGYGAQGGDAHADVVCGAYDGSLYRWSADTGALVAVVGGAHSREVTACHSADFGRGALFFHTQFD